ncbi:MAG: DUF2817 domain-containing protein, partial [Enterobacteriaceae bacterium]
MISISQSRYFSNSYQQARQRFLSAAQPVATELREYPLAAVGRQGETLSTDVAWIESEGAERLLIISSATHGVEGFCGSGCQLAVLDDDELLARARQAGVALLLIHAVNPYGFSWISRTDQYNVDLNRNAHPFCEQALPANPAYSDLMPLLLPEQWPPDAANRVAIAAYQAEQGVANYSATVSRGQYQHADGLFYGGTKASPSLITLRTILEHYASRYAHIGWIDIHTGL